MAYGTGSRIPGWIAPPKKKDPYPASIAQYGGDYDDIMARYRKFLGQGDQQFNQLFGQYQKQVDQGPSAASQDALRNLASLSRTGGYSEGDKADLRSRGISPIRSIYANAQQNLSRNRALGGGYSPNYAASSAKMARELSQGISDITTNVDAGIAQNVAQGRLSAAPQYAHYANMQDTNKLNSLGALQSLYGMKNQSTLGALSGMQGMYGTTPAGPAMFGQHMFQNRQLDQNQEQINNNASNSLMNYYSQFKRPGAFRLG